MGRGSRQRRAARRPDPAVGDDRRRRAVRAGLGAHYDSGTATHAMTLYRAASGALVFSAGTPQYSWGLDEQHNYWTGRRASARSRWSARALQQATVNLLADMGVQPASLQPDLRAATRVADPLAPQPAVAATLGAPADLRGPPDEAAAGPRRRKDPCAAPTNKIIAENCKPGNPSTEWDINGAGDPIDSGVLHRHQLQPRRDGAIQDPDRFGAVPHRYLSHRLLRRAGRAADHRRPAVGHPAAAAAGVRRRLERRGSTTAATGRCRRPGRFRPMRCRVSTSRGWSARTARRPGAWTTAASRADAAARTACLRRLGLGTLRNPLKEPRASHIVFIVRDDASKADIVMQTSDPTGRPTTPTVSAASTTASPRRASRAAGTSAPTR